MNNTALRAEVQSANNKHMVFANTEGTPSVDDYESGEERLSECREYSVSDLFCCGYEMYFWQGREAAMMRTLSGKVPRIISSESVKACEKQNFTRLFLRLKL